jgi:hypothetical protein
MMLAEADDHGQTDTCKQGQGLQVHVHTGQGQRTVSTGGKLNTDWHR